MKIKAQKQHLLVLAVLIIGATVFSLIQLTTASSAEKLDMRCPISA